MPSPYTFHKFRGHGREVAEAWPLMHVVQSARIGASEIYRARSSP